MDEREAALKAWRERKQIEAELRERVDTAEREASVERARLGRGYTEQAIEQVARALVTAPDSARVAPELTGGEATWMNRTEEQHKVAVKTTAAAVYMIQQAHDSTMLGRQQQRARMLAEHTRQSQQILNDYDTRTAATEQQHRSTLMAMVAVTLPPRTGATLLNHPAQWTVASRSEAGFETIVGAAVGEASQARHYHRQRQQRLHAEQQAAYVLLQAPVTRQCDEEIRRINATPLGQPRPPPRR